MKRTAAILALVAVVSLLGASDVRGGDAGVPAAKTTGTSLVATIVMDLTGSGTSDPKGLTSIRIQRSGSSAAALFMSGVVFGVPCDTVRQEMGRFEGKKMDGWVPGGVLTSLFGSGVQPVITDTDYATCNSVNGGFGGVGVTGTREVLSFTAVIQFEK